MIHPPADVITHVGSKDRYHLSAYKCLALSFNV